MNSVVFLILEIISDNWCAKLHL